MVGACKLPLSELVADAPKPNPETGLYAKHEDGKHDMKEFSVSGIINSRDRAAELPTAAYHH
jgi:phosphatidylserine decarboxylase